MKQLRLAAILMTILGVGCMTTGTYDTYGTPQYAQPYAATAAHGTGVFVNGTELGASDKAQLDAIVGQSVPAGRYWMDASYNFGYENEPASVNLRDLYLAKYPPERSQERGVSMYSTDSAGRGSSIVSEGGCTILSTPSGSLSSGC
ncbi:MAG: hypothetical protein AB7T06_28710 [Kofleriaceae bacterium]